MTIGLIAERGAAPVHHIGPKRDLALIEAAVQAGARPVLVGLEQASYVLCTGLFDDRVETPDDYARTSERDGGAAADARSAPIRIWSFIAAPT